MTNNKEVKSKNWEILFDLWSAQQNKLEEAVLRRSKWSKLVDLYAKAEKLSTDQRDAMLYRLLHSGTESRKIRSQLQNWAKNLPAIRARLARQERDDLIDPFKIRNAYNKEKQAKPAEKQAKPAEKQAKPAEKQASDDYFHPEAPANDDFALQKTQPSPAVGKKQRKVYNDTFDDYDPQTTMQLPAIKQQNNRNDTQKDVKTIHGRPKYAVRKQKIGHSPQKTTQLDTRYLQRQADFDKARAYDKKRKAMSSDFDPQATIPDFSAYKDYEIGNKPRNKQKNRSKILQRTQTQEVLERNRLIIKEIVNQLTEFLYKKLNESKNI